MAVFRLRLNNPLIVQGVKNRLYVIQFTRYRRASERKLLDYITFDSVCQELFSIFSKLFRVDSSLAALVSNSVILSHLFELVKNFFRFFSKFFELWRCAPSQGFSSRNFYMIPQKASFVKNFSQILSISAHLWHYLTALSDSLDIIPPPSPFVKHFFTKNSIYFCVLLTQTSVLLSCHSLKPTG